MVCRVRSRLTSFSGIDGVNVMVRSLARALPVAGVEVRLIARNNEVLGTTKTDARGMARFDPGLSRGAGGLAPGLLTASTSEGDYNFLDLQQTAFDLSDRGVKGRPAALALDAFVYTERGVYRSGETVNVTGLLRDARGEPATGLPITFVVRRPDGVEYRRTVVNDQGLGGRALPIPLVSSAPTGTWRVLAYADPRSPAIGQATFLVEDYVPERLDVTLTAKEKLMEPGGETPIEAAVRFLYGAPGAGLEITGEVIVQAARRLAIPGYEDYTSGLADQEFETIKNEIEEKATTDAQGKATINVDLPETNTSKPLEARIILRAAEPGGRAVERTLTLPVKPEKSLIAVKPNFTELREGQQATFNVVALSEEGERLAAKGLRWTLYRVTNSYQWYNSDGRWAFERVKATQKVAEGQTDVTTGELASIAAPVRWGNYRLDIVSEDGELAPVGYAFSTGWSGEATADTPDLLEVTLDKKDYRAGDTMKLRVVSRFDGKATVAIIADRLRETVMVDLKTGDNDIEVPVKGDWGASAYAVAFAHRPLDTQARRMPGRAMGLAWFSVEAESRRIGVNIDMPERATPRKPVTIPVRLAGLAAGEEAYVTVAAVDVGILNITRYQTPDPTTHFYGQRQLASEIRDLYGLLIDGMQGTRGAIRQGGDAAGGGNEGNRPTQEPLARFSGVVRVGPDGVANVTFELPAFNGTMRVMAVAWSKGRTGHAQKDVIVRDAVVAQATLPRFLNFGDRSQFHVQLDNVDGAPGDYTVDFDIRGPVSIAAQALRRTLRLDAKARTAFSIPVSAAGTGIAQMTMRVTGPNFDASQDFIISVKPGTSELYRRTVRMVQPGQSITISNDLIADFLPGTGAISIAASPLGAIDVPALLQALDRYPYGCSEQIVSRAMPLLYVSQLAPAGRLALDGDTRERVQSSIERVMARQDSTGSFGLWSSENANDLWLDAFVTDFLTRARENNYQVPQRGFEQALDQLRNQVVNAREVTNGNGADIAYAIYVLARNGRPIMGDLRYLADARINQFATPLARAQIGAALALLGDRSRAAAAFQSASQQLALAQSTAFSRPDYGSLLRDSAGVLALAAETNADQGLMLRAAQRLQEAQSSTRFTSTQEQGWMVLAASALTKQAQNMALTIDGAPHQGAWFANFRGLTLDNRTVTIGNAGQSPAQVVITTSGNPAVREPAESQGYTLERSYYRLDGKPADLATVKQNDRLVVVLKITEPQALFARLLLVDKLPAGLEIDNPRLVDSGQLSGLPWLKSEVTPEHAEYRDDRFVAAFTRTGRGKPAIFYAAYVVRAVTPGTYVLPPASIEDMYRPERFGRTAYGTLNVAGAQQ
jgi:alpha-2-macroglobulin